MFVAQDGFEVLEVPPLFFSCGKVVVSWQSYEEPKKEDPNASMLFSRRDTTGCSETHDLL